MPSFCDNLTTTDQTSSEQSACDHIEGSRHRLNGCTISAFADAIEKSKKPEWRWPTSLLGFKPGTPPSCPQCATFLFTQSCCFYSETRTSPGQWWAGALSLSITANRASCRTFCRGIEWVTLHTRPYTPCSLVCQTQLPVCTVPTPSRPQGPPPKL
jgi:hypothetical protein